MTGLKSIIDMFSGPVATGIETALDPTELNRCEDESVKARNDVYDMWEKERSQERLDALDQYEREQFVVDKYEEKIKSLEQDLNEWKSNSSPPNYVDHSDDVGASIQSQTYIDTYSGSGSTSDTGSGTGDLY